MRVNAKQANLQKIYNIFSLTQLKKYHDRVHSLEIQYLQIKYKNDWKINKLT